MKYIIRTIKDGKRLPLADVNKKRVEAKERILSIGSQYTETESQLGSFNAMGKRIEERVYIIEDISGADYV